MLLTAGIRSLSAVRIAVRATGGGKALTVERDSAAMTRDCAGDSETLPSYARAQLASQAGLLDHPRPPLVTAVLVPDVPVPGKRTVPGPVVLRPPPRIKAHVPPGHHAIRCRGPARLSRHTGRWQPSHSPPSQVTNLRNSPRLRPCEKATVSGGNRGRAHDPPVIRSGGARIAVGWGRETLRACPPGEPPTQPRPPTRSGGSCGPGFADQAVHRQQASRRPGLSLAGSRVCDGRAAPFLRAQSDSRPAQRTGARVAAPARLSGRRDWRVPARTGRIRAAQCRRVRAVPEFRGGADGAMPGSASCNEHGRGVRAGPLAAAGASTGAVSAARAAVPSAGSWGSRSKCLVWVP